MHKESRFEGKLLYFIIVLLMLKLLYIIFDTLLNGDFGGFLLALFIIIIIFLGVGLFIASMFKSSGESSGNGGGTTVGDDQFQKLMDRYEKLCDGFIEKKQFKKAAYIQLKLLRNPYRAAYIFEEANLHSDAALIYLKKCNDKQNAAECYEKARSYKKAIKLYKELDAHESVGDIYTKIKDTKNAHHHYKIVVDDYAKNDQYVKASLIYRKKMDDKVAASQLLVKGWRENKDAVNCLNNHFVHFESKKELQSEINHFYKYEVQEANNLNFLNVLKTEFKKPVAPKEDIQSIAYELISNNNKNSEILSNLHHFVEEDSQIVPDVIRHRAKK
ncbi:tetratricopeptide repeat protein [Kordia sp.]|uniref:tetratricopeptide repeat protein n=1 Tax=Kordia sp. TaxID=1965332 RepID=UPI003D2E5020